MTKQKYQGFWRFIDSISYAAPAALAAFGSVAVFFLLIDQFKGIFIWPLGLAAASVTWAIIFRKMPLASDSKKELRWCNVLVLIGVLAWGVGNSLYAGQHVFTNRDPASYAVTGVWLSQNNSVKVDKQSVLPNVEGVETHSGGFTASKTDGEHLYSRGPHLFPALLGLVGAIGGETLLFRLNPFIGALAILALYGLSRLYVRPRWALFGAAVFAVSLPLIYFSRDTYTEPLTVVLAFGALSLLWAAQKSKSIALWALAGLTAGSGALVRIDSFLVIAALLLFAGIYLALARKAERRVSLQSVGAFIGGMMLPALLGWLNFSLLTGTYFNKHISPFMVQMYLIGAVFLFCTALVFFAWRTSLLSRLEKITRRWRVSAAVIFTALIAAFLALRPLWYVSYGETVRGGVTTEYRNYAELTVNWVSWYIGPIIALLAVGGICIIVARLLTRRRNIILLAPLCAIIIPTIVYLVKPSIAADHIWASRRLLPIILPGLIFFGIFAFDWLYSHTKSFSLKRYAIYAVAGMALIFPFLTSLPFLTLRPYVPQLARVADTCKALPSHSILIWVGKARTEAIQPTRLFCQLPVAGYGKAFSSSDAPSKITLKAIAKQASAEGRRPIIGLYDRDEALLGKSANLTTVHTSTTSDIRPTFTSVPKEIGQNTTSILLGEIQKDGSVKELQR